MVFSRVEIWWNVGSKNRETRGWTTVHPGHRKVCHRWPGYGLWHRQRIEPFAKVTVILAQGEWSIAKDMGPFFRRCNSRHRQTFFNLWNVYVFNIGGICIHEKGLLRKFTFHQTKTVNDLTLKQTFDISEKLIVWQSDEIFGVSQINEVDSPWKHLSLANDEEIISLSHANVYVFSDSVLCLGKVNQNPTSNTVWEEKLSWFKDSPHYRTLDTIDGEPMEFELIIKVQEFMTKMGDPSQFKGRIIFMSIFNDIIWSSEDNERECIANATLVTLFAKRFPPGRGHSSDLDQKRSGILIRQTTRRMWQSRWIDDDQVQRKRTPSFPSHESIVPRNAQKQRRWKIINTLLCRWRYDWNCFSHNDFCKSAQYLRSSFRFVWWIQCLSSKNGETRAGRTIWPIVRASKIVDDNTYPFDWSSCTRKFIAKVQGTSGKALTTRPIDKILYWCRIPENSWSRTVLHDKGHWRVLTIHRISGMSWVHFATRWKINWPERLDSREHQNWARVRSHNQLLAM